MDERSITRADLVDLLSALKAEIVAELKSELATRTDLAELRTEVGELRTEVGELRAELADTKDAVQEQVRDSQTEMLKAFLPYQERTNVRFRAFEAKVSNTDAELRARMEILEARLDQIETKLHLPPAA